MKNLLPSLILMLLCSNALAAPTADEAFENLAEEFVSDLVNFSLSRTTTWALECAVALLVWSSVP